MSKRRQVPVWVLAEGMGGGEVQCRQCQPPSLARQADIILWYPEELLLVSIVPERRDQSCGAAQGSLLFKRRCSFSQS